MSWLTDKFKRIKPKIKNLFRVKIGPEGKLWENCSCGAVLYKQDLKENLYVCNKCHKHHHIEPKERFEIFFDEGQYQEISPMLPAIDDPLIFPSEKSYVKKLKEAREKTGMHDTVMLATGKVNNVYLVAAAFSFKFLGGSVGRAAGEAIVAGAEFAYSNKIGYVIFFQSGGMRMYEGAFSLSQMVRMVAAINSIKQEKLPFISVLLDPCYGGTTASIAMLGDVNIAEKGARIGFSGKDVIKSTIRTELPPEFQEASYVHEKGQLDIVAERKDLRKIISTLISQMTNKNKTFLSENQLINEQQQSPLGTVRSIDPITKTSS
jgi:acetyl-CoA carboxylase carboxyl transferase subunit beta